MVVTGPPKRRRSGAAPPACVLLVPTRTHRRERCVFSVQEHTKRSVGYDAVNSKCCCAGDLFSCRALSFDLGGVLADCHPIRTLFPRCATTACNTPPRRKWSHLNVTLREIDFDKQIKDAPTRYRREKLEARKDEVSARGRGFPDVQGLCAGGGEAPHGSRICSVPVGGGGRRPTSHRATIAMCICPHHHRHI